MNRLLSDEEIIHAATRVSSPYRTYFEDHIEEARSIAVDQRDLTRSETLKEVGEWLQLTLMHSGERVRVPGMTDVTVLHPLDLNSLIKALKSGNMPEAK